MEELPLYPSRSTSIYEAPVGVQRGEEKEEKPVKMEELVEPIKRKNTTNSNQQRAVATNSNQQRAVAIQI